VGRAGGLRWLTRAAVLLALAIAFQSLRLGQAVTGPAVNAILLTAGVVIGPWGGAAIGLLTPVTAFFLGVLKPVLAPAIPFIMLGNAVLVLIFAYGRRMNVYLAIIAAAAAKYLLLSAAVVYIISLPGPVSVALRLPQLFTALGGGLVALVILEALAAGGVVSRADWPGLGLGARRKEAGER
jgi:predicted membrane protein